MSLLYGMEHVMRTVEDLREEINHLRDRVSRLVLERDSWRLEVVRLKGQIEEDRG